MAAASTRPSHRHRASAWNLWWRWIAANAWGELVGLGGVFCVGMYVTRRWGEPVTPALQIAFVLLVVVLAVFEGSVVGYAQWRVLRQYRSTLRRGAWLTATIVGALVAWILGMVPGLLAPEMGDTGGESPAPGWVVAASAAMGFVLGLVLAGAQWRVLRRHFTDAAWWLPANGLAWAAAMPLIFWLVGVTIAEAQTVARLLVLVAGLGAAGGLAGAIHGLALVMLIRRNNGNGT